MFFPLAKFQLQDTGFYKKQAIVLFIALSGLLCYGQYPKDYFGPPLKVPLLLAGNFGELRSNHFHSGLDLKTQGKEGLPVIAVGDGYISRIKVSATGYGKALYITHPNGFVSVYAHLKYFNSDIEAHTKKVQYSIKSFEIDTAVAAGVLSIKKGQIIAFSGNTGGSGGPHLHFEIREEKSECPINPVLFGIKIEDNSKPIIQGLYVYHFEDNFFQESICDKNTLPLKYEVNGNNGKYSVKHAGPILIHSNTGFGISAFDQQSGTSNKNGIYSIELTLDGKRIYYHDMERFSFDETRYINSHIDFYEQRKNRNYVQKSFIATNNKLSIYKDIINNGIINLTDTNIHKVTYILRDLNMNTSYLSFDIKKSTTPPTIKYPVSCVAVYDCSKENTFQTQDITITFPPGCFYENTKFNYSVSKEKIKGALIFTHKIHDKYFPVHSKYQVSFRVPAIPEKYRDKVVVVSIDKNNYYYEGGIYYNETVSTELKSFGDFTIMIDSVPPTIKPINIAEGKDLSTANIISLKTFDKLSEISDYDGFINGKWVIVEYDAKNNHLFYKIDHDLPKGNHSFKLIVKDKSNNEAMYEANFTR